MSSANNREVLRAANYSRSFESINYKKCYEFIFKVEALKFYLVEYKPEALKSTLVENLREVMKVMGTENDDELIYFIKSYRNALVHELYPALAVASDTFYIDEMLAIVNDLHFLCADSFARRAKRISIFS